MDFTDPLIKEMVCRDHVPMETLETVRVTRADGTSAILGPVEDPIIVTCTFDGAPWPCEVIHRYRAFVADNRRLRA